MAATIAVTACAKTAEPPKELHVVGLGDSVPAAAGCSCTSFVVLYGQDAQKHTGRPATVDNLAKSGLTSSGLLAQLNEPAVAEVVARADLITVTIGANDFASARADYSAGTCGGADGLACMHSSLDQLESTLTDVLTRIQTLTEQHAVGVRVTNYWNVFEAGEVARDKYGDAFPAQSDRLTQEANAVICTVAKEAGDLCIDVYKAYQDASPNGDPTSLLAPDGDHPNQAGHDLIAHTIAAAGYAPVG